MRGRTTDSASGAAEWPRAARYAIGLAVLAVAPAVSVEVRAEEEDLIDEIVVVAISDHLALLPAEESASAFGLSKGLLETPRAVTEVRSDLIERYALRSVDDLVRLTPGAFTSSFFGIRGAMDIRGEPADNYYRGFRRIANPGNFNTVVGGARKLEILRGPVSPYHGTGSVGGQLNYVPKSAIDDAAAVDTGWSVDVSVGSYDRRAVAAEVTVPFEIRGRRAGVHVFADVEDSGSFYHGYEPSTELLQLSFAVGGRTSFDFGVQYHTTDSVQVPGWNRVTQELIDDGVYVTGRPPPRNDPGNPVGADRLLPQESGDVGSFAPPFLNSSFSRMGTFCDPGTPENHNFTYNGRPLSCAGAPALTALVADSVGTAKLGHRTTFIDRVDFADTETVTAYVEVARQLGDRSFWRNELFYDYLDHDKYQSWGFTAHYPGANVAEFRSSLTFEAPLFDLLSRNLLGISLRREDLPKYHSFFDETFDHRDLTVGPTPDDRLDWAVIDVYRDARVVQTEEGPVLDGTVRRNFDNIELSRSDNLGIFALSDLIAGPVSVLVGLRYDLFYVESVNVARTLLDLPFDDSGTQRGKKGRPSYSLSASWYFEPGVIPYVTWAESNSPQVNQLGGVFPGSVRNGSFLQQSELLEAGIKANLASGRIYTTLCWYDQEKSLHDDGPTAGRSSAEIGFEGRRISAEGIELEVRAVLNDRLSFVMTATDTRTLEVGDDVFTVVNGADFARQNGLEPWQVYGGRIAGARSTFVGAGVELERSGLPDNTVSFYGTWTQPIAGGRIAATAGLIWASETYADALQVIELPEYSVWTASLSYERDRLGVLLQANNILDEEYYTSSDLFDAVVVKPSEGRTVFLTLSWDFGPRG